MQWNLQRFKAVFPKLRDYLETVVPDLVKQYDHYVRRLGPNCMYARACLKVMFIEAQRRDRSGFEQSLRTWGYL